MKILVTDDSRLSRMITSDALEELGHKVICAESGEEAIRLFQKDRPDLIILDVVMNGMNGFECASKLRKLDVNEWIPIIFLSGVIDDENVAKGIDAGGDDYLIKPFSKITLSAKIRSMERIAEMRHALLETQKKLETLSTTDALTNIYNRFQFDRSIQEILAENNRNNTKSALFFIDVDHFKKINDTLGHHAGDELLKMVSKRLTSCLRINDLIARLGGDEFAIVLRTIKDPTVAEEVAKKIIHLFETPLVIEGQELKITLSIGIACYPQDGNNPKKLMQSADISLYRSKKAGRNQYQFYKS